jgi:hypothetical protein
MHKALTESLCFMENLQVTDVPFSTAAAQQQARERAAREEEGTPRTMVLQEPWIRRFDNKQILA